MYYELINYLKITLQILPDPMKKIFPVLCFLLFASTIHCQNRALLQDPYEGLWLGTMVVTEQMSLQMAFEIEASAAGGYAARMNVIEQRAFDIPMDTCMINSDTIHIRFSSAGITYDGVYSAEQDNIAGTYAQGGGRFDLDLSRVDELPLEVERPQTPVRPFPYLEEEVTFRNEKAGITLAGTYTRPEEGKNLRSAVLVAGSGANDRDETPMGHFLLLSDFLTRNGYAVLRYDKRGVGESEGDYGAASTYDFADDARAALNYLRSRPETDPGKAGIIGHSEGGVIAPIVASEYPEEVSYIVMMGGIGITGIELLLVQSAKMAVITGVSEEQIAEISRINKSLYEIALTDEPDSVKREQFREVAPNVPETQYQMLLWPWFQTFLALDPDIYLSKVSCPTLAITGENDIQCPPEENLAAMEASLKKAGNTRYEIKTLPGLNHLFQHSESGSPLEYEQIPEIMAPESLEFILTWLNSLDP